VDSFKEEEIEGDILLDALADPEIFEELQITSCLHQMRIMHLFPKELLGENIKYSKEHLCNFLQEQDKLKQHIPILMDSGIDGDMILEVDSGSIKKVLQEIGVSKLQSAQIISKYKRFVEELP
jgi:hypothetical protein